MLALQACISFCSVSDKSVALLRLPCSHKTVVAHIFAALLASGSQGYAELARGLNLQVVLHGVATLKVRKGACDTLNTGSGALGK